MRYGGTWSDERSLQTTAPQTRARYLANECTRAVRGGVT